MKREKAIRLDEILKNLSMKHYRSRDELKERIGEVVPYSDISTLRSQKYNGNRIVRSKIENRKRVLNLTIDGAAFRDDVGFLKMFRADKRTNRFQNIHMTFTIIGGIVAIVALLLSQIQNNKQKTQLDNLKEKVDTIETSLNL